MKPPAFLTIGHRTLSFTITPATEMVNGDRGHYDPHAMRIRVADDLSPPDRAETALHEVLHACFPAFDLPADSDVAEEMIVAVMAMNLAQTLRDNPEFWAWASDALRVKTVLKPLTAADKKRFIRKGSIVKSFN